MTVRRARFRCSVSGRYYFPLDAVLDLPPWEVAVSLGKRGMRLATHMGFAELQEELRYQHEVDLSDTVLNQLMQQVGGVWEGDRQEGVIQKRQRLVRVR